MGCGYLPASIVSKPNWRHPLDRGEYTVCPGFSSSLPDVADVARVYLHWEKGNLAAVVPKKRINATLTGCLELLHSSVTALTNAKNMESASGGKS